MSTQARALEGPFAAAAITHKLRSYGDSTEAVLVRCSEAGLCVKLAGKQACGNPAEGCRIAQCAGCVEELPTNMCHSNRTLG